MAGLSQRGPQASSGVVFHVPQAAPCPLRQAWAGRPLSHAEFLCVGGRQGRWVGAGAGQMVCARPYRLGVGRQAGREEPPSQSLLCLPAAGPQEWTLLPSCPTKSLPSTTAGAPHPGTPARPLQLRASSGRGCPGGAKQGHQANSSTGGAGEGTTGLWLRGRSLSGEALTGWIPATSEAALMGKRSLCGGVGSPEPPSLAQPCPGQPTLGSGHLLWPSGL